MKRSLLSWLMCIPVVLASAQNNPIFQGGSGDGVDKKSFLQSGNAIFTGGNADGWNKSSFSQASNNIFSGGSGDGWNKTSFAQSASAIFTGGSGDGWNKTSFLQAGNSIFNGGNGDGWTNTSFLQPGNDIFAGGQGDGWNKTNFLQSGNNIYNGGIGDGWSSTYRPQAPLPVKYSYFTATKSGTSASLLRWETQVENNSSYFDVERSTDAVHYQFIGKVAAAGFSSSPVSYQFTDHAPASGFNYYRLKQVDRDGMMEYTPSRLVRFDGLDAGSVRYYPNPTRGILQIDISAVSNKEIKVVTISNASGIVVQQFIPRLSNDAKIDVDLSKFPKGIYFIQLKMASFNSTQRIVLQ